MANVQCFLLEPTDRVRQKLRRYRSSSSGDRCPAMPGAYSFHNAETSIEDAPARFRDDDTGVMTNGSKAEDVAAYANDPRWPTQCSCGYTFTDEDNRQLFCDRIYRRVDTGEETTLRDAPAGAMWRATWWMRQQSQDTGAPLYVKLPDGTDWGIDSNANNCTIADDWKQERHHCWPRRGEPPNVTVDKSFGPTCNAGAGSIATPGYHGFLRNGVLESC